MTSLTILKLNMVLQVAVLATCPKDIQSPLLTHHPAVYLVSFKDLRNSKSGDVFFFLTLKVQQVPRNKTAFLYQISCIKGDLLSTCIIWFLHNLTVSI